MGFVATCTGMQMVLCPVRGGDGDVACFATGQAWVCHVMCAETHSTAHIPLDIAMRTAVVHRLFILQPTWQLLLGTHHSAHGNAHLSAHYKAQQRTPPQCMWFPLYCPANAHACTADVVLTIPCVSSLLPHPLHRSSVARLHCTWEGIPRL
jgi:hypothetical protein